MSVKQECQDAIKAGKLKDALLIAFSNNLNLKITTSIISLEKNEAYSLRSKLNLLEGLETEISHKFLNKKYESCSQFHRQQINEAYEIWQKNRLTLIKVFQVLAGMTQQQEISGKEKLNLSPQSPLLDVVENISSSEIIETIEIKESNLQEEELFLDEDKLIISSSVNDDDLEYLDKNEEETLDSNAESVLEFDDFEMSSNELNEANFSEDNREESALEFDNFEMASNELNEANFSEDNREESALEFDDFEMSSNELNEANFSEDNGEESALEFDNFEMASEELNEDNFSEDNGQENQENTFDLETENIDSENANEEDWGDLLDEMETSENKQETPAKSSPCLEIGDEEDWGEWIEEGDLQANPAAANIEEIEWEDEENWEDFNPNYPVENMKEER